MARFEFLAAWSEAQDLEPLWPSFAALDLARLGGRLVETGFPLKLFVFGDDAGQVRTTGDGGLILGRLFEAPPSYLAAPRRFEIEGQDASERGQRLLRRYWGGYVALFPDRAGLAVMRDPSGAMEALLWRARGLRWAASSLDVAPASLAPELTIDWDALGAQVADRLRTSGDPPLRGLKAAPAGGLVRASGETVMLWTPAMMARRSADEASPERLRQVTGGCVAAWGSSLSRPWVEVSGGLDSAIVTASLGPRTRARAAGFVNHVVEEEGADERAYARAVTDRWDVSLTEVLKGEAELDPQALERSAGSPRPAFNAADVDYDEAVAALACEAGADAVVTGQGGDAVFLTLRSPALAVDLLRRRPLAGLADPQLMALARWTQRSVWSLVLRSAVGGWNVRPCDRWARFASMPAKRLAQAARPHPWLQDTTGLGPGRRLQITGLVDALIFQGASRRARTTALIHPLLSQPLLESVLTLPVEALVRGGRDRGLAREAFASALPPQIVQRRSKGDMTAFYGRMIARSLDRLRPFLLDGALAAAGLVDIQKLDCALTPERLTADGGYGEIMDLAVQEAWARHWTKGEGAR